MKNETQKELSGQLREVDTSKNTPGLEEERKKTSLSTPLVMTKIDLYLQYSKFEKKYLIFKSK